MAAQKGRSFTLKDGTATGGTTIAAMKVTGFTVNGEAVDVTTKDSAGARTLLAAAGKYSISVTAQGLLDGNAQATTFINRVIAQSIDTYGIVFDNGDKIDGSWQMTSFQSEGTEGDAQNYSMTLESSGAMTVTAV